MAMEIVLASASPRRRELMELMGLSFTVDASDADESVPAGTAPEEMVRILAMRKAQAVKGKHPGSCVVGSDTVVCLDGQVLGKPRDDEQAAEYLRMLSGRTHTVYTGIALVTDGFCDARTDATLVTFAPLTAEEISAYVSTGDSRDKAGAYGIQGPFCKHVTSISGSYHTVIGLPVHLLYQMLCRHGILQ